MEPAYHLPNELINKIFMYVSSVHVDIVRGSRFYRSPSPFFYLNHVSFQDVDDPFLQDDIIELNSVVVADRFMFHLEKGIEPCQDDVEVVDDSDNYDISIYNSLEYRL